MTTQCMIRQRWLSILLSVTRELCKTANTTLPNFYTICSSHIVLFFVPNNVAKFRRYLRIKLSLRWGLLVQEFECQLIAAGSGHIGHHLPGSVRLQAVQGSTWHGVAERRSVRSPDHVCTRHALRRTSCSRSGVSVADCDRLGSGDCDHWSLLGSLSTVSCCRLEDTPMCPAYSACRCRRCAPLQHSYILREQGTVSRE